MNPLIAGPLSIMAAMAMASSRTGREVEVLTLKHSPSWGRPAYLPPLRNIPFGIPTPQRPNQRQRRKLHRQTRPHGWKGGAR